MDLLVSRERLAAIERPLTDAAGIGTCSRVDDSMLKEMAPFLEALSTI